MNVLMSRRVRTEDKIVISKNGFDNKIEKDKYQNSMSIVDELRISPFFPIEKISSRSKIYKDFITNGNKHIRQTSWGELEIRNRILTQNHLLIFSVLMAYKREIVKLESGMIAIYFSMYEVAKTLGLSWSGRTSSELEEIIKQISDVKIMRTYKNKNKYSYGIIDKISYSDKKDTWGIILSSEYSNLFEKSIRF